MTSHDPLVPSAGRTVNIPAGDGAALQNALNNAIAGDTIVLVAGSVYNTVSGFSIPNWLGGGFNDNDESTWVTITSSQRSLLPPQGTRVQPSDEVHMPVFSKIPGDYYAPAFTAAASAHHFRFYGLSLTMDDATLGFLPPNPGNPGATKSGGYGIWAMMFLGTSNEIPYGSPLSLLPHHIAVEQCYMHFAEGQDIVWGVQFNCGYLRVRDSYLMGIKSLQSEAKVFGGTFGSGPFYFCNNHIEGGWINFLYGGGDSQFTEIVIPSDFYFVRNHFPAPPEYYANYPGFIPATYTDAVNYRVWPRKNIYEYKIGQRTVLEGNILEYSWIASDQRGFAIMFTQRQSFTSLWNVSRDHIVRYNIIGHANCGSNHLGKNDYSNYLDWTQGGNVLYEHNFWYDINPFWGAWPGDASPGSTQLIGGPAYRDCTVRNNTVLDSFMAAFLGRIPIDWNAYGGYFTAPDPVDTPVSITLTGTDFWNSSRVASATINLSTTRIAPSEKQPEPHALSNLSLSPANVTLGPGQSQVFKPSGQQDTCCPGSTLDVPGNLVWASTPFPSGSLFREMRPGANVGYYTPIPWDLYPDSCVWDNITYERNIMHTPMAIIAGDSFPYDATGALDVFASKPGTTPHLEDNVFIGANPGPLWINPSDIRFVNNSFPANVAAVGFLNPDLTIPEPHTIAPFEPHNRIPANYALSPSSPYHPNNNGGKQIGCDMATVLYMTRGCVSGVWDTAIDLPAPPFPQMALLPTGGPSPDPPTPPGEPTPGPVGPILSSISPSSGVQGTSVPVVITGQNLLGAGISFSGSGIIATSVYSTATQITATFIINAGAATGARTITVDAAGGTTSISFTVNAPSPPPTGEIVIHNVGQIADIPSSLLEINGSVDLVGSTPQYLINGVPIGGGGGQAQTPWTQNIDAANYSLSNLSGVTLGNNTVTGTPTISFVTNSAQWNMVVFGSSGSAPGELQITTGGVPYITLDSQGLTLGGLRLQGNFATFGGPAFFNVVEFGLQTDLRRYSFRATGNIQGPDSILQIMANDYPYITFSGYSTLSTIALPYLRTTQPAAGSKELWCDTENGNVVKYGA